MKRVFLSSMLAFSLILIFVTVSAADFYVIPLKQRHYAPVEKTGQATCYNAEGDVIDCAGTGQDGSLQDGVGWPEPRFTDNGDGTVTDRLTGLIWTKNLGCHVGNWQSDLDFCNALATGTCGLTDGSGAGDWRLANRNELLSLLDHSQYMPALPTGHPFVVSDSANFISSTTVVSGPTAAWIVGIYHGTSGLGLKSGNWYGACVRGGHS
jgi:hypothetical protein